MYQIFPTIDERKIIFLSLTELSTDEKLISSIDDNFIILLPSQGEITNSTLLSLNKNTIVQALDVQLKDLKFEDYNLSINLDNNIIELHLFEKTQESYSEINKQLEFHSLKISLVDDYDDSFRLQLSNPMNYNSSLELILKIALHSKLNDNVVIYRRYCKFHIVPKSKIQFLALDFGSEASQMRRGNYGNGLDVSEHKVPLFSIMKRHDDNGPHKSANEAYKQYETEYLFKSIFYSNKKIDATKAEMQINGNEVFWCGNALKMIVLKNQTDQQQFLNDNKLIPNLKLIKRGSELTSGYQFEVKENNVDAVKTFDDMRESLYLGLLKKMLESFVSQANLNECFLRLTILVPNIYTVHEIRDTKNGLSKILENLIKQRKLSGFEIDCISESDASFLGSRVEIKQNQFYIIIDCGKGTTDYSIVQFDESSQGTFNSIYRNGIAGAGNYITFSFLKAAFNFLKEKYGSSATAFYELLLQDRNLWIHSQLFEEVERWKKGYNPAANSIDMVEQEWIMAKSETLTLDNFFSRAVQLDTEIGDFIVILKEINHCSDWGNYISDAIDSITSSVKSQLEPVINHQLKNGFKCRGIILTGRGSMFKPLVSSIKSSLNAIKGMHEVQLINQEEVNLKEICLSGIFHKNICFYSDLISTPIEVHINEINKQVLKPTSKNWFEKLIQMFSSQPGIGAAYDSNTNSIEVINSTELNFNVRFWIGGKLYKPQRVYKGSQSLDYFLIPSKKETYLIGKGSDGLVQFRATLIEDMTQKDMENEKRIRESLYPNIIVAPF